MSKLQSKEMDQLFEAVLALQTKEECYAFFEDICTISELKDISQRLMVATMLSNKKSYHEISEATGASTATISRVNRCLTYGNDGYTLILERLKQHAQ